LRTGTVILAPAPASASHQGLLLAVVAVVFLVAALGFFFIFQLLLAPASRIITPDSTHTLFAVATAVAQQKWTEAELGCATLVSNPPTDPTLAPQLARNYFACGLYLVQPGKPDVNTARDYFVRAAQLLPADPDIVHQLDLANRYHTAYLTVLKPDLGSYIDQLEWFTVQPEFANKPYADTATLLYNAYLDSGRGYLQVYVCDQALHRFEQATRLKFVNTDQARTLLEQAHTLCK
jgi:hypothetical protein